jgi:hypothetical protein
MMISMFLRANRLFPFEKARNHECPIRVEHVKNKITSSGTSTENYEGGNEVVRLLSGACGLPPRRVDGTHWADGGTISTRASSLSAFEAVVGSRVRTVNLTGRSI